MANQRTLLYIADPMCSWCWGFAPVISAIEEAYKDELHIGLIMGGLRPGTANPVTAEFRETTLGHWREVNKRTGQPFKFDGVMPRGFIYNTEPPSRAVVTAGELNPPAMFPYFKSIQHAFYVEGKDVTKSEMLAELAQQQSIESTTFLRLFRSDKIKNQTKMHFGQSKQAGITGFPAAILQDAAGAELLTVGYQPFESLKPKIDAWLAQPR
jgi:putative protein-disulfide isomerase